MPRSTFQAAGLSVAGSPLPQALILLRQRLACRASSAPADILLRTARESTRVCADQFGGGPTDDRHRRRTRSRTHDRPVLTTSRHIATFPLLHAKNSRAELRAPYALYAHNHACRPKWLRLRDQKWLCFLARYQTTASLREHIYYSPPQRGLSRSQRESARTLSTPRTLFERPRRRVTESPGAVLSISDSRSYSNGRGETESPNPTQSMSTRTWSCGSSTDA